MFFGVDIKTILIACPLVGLAGFVDSIAGGGGLISLPAYLMAGLSPVAASATNKISALMGACVAFGNYLKKGFVNVKLAIPCCLLAILFSSLGAKIQTIIPEEYLKIFMLVALPLTLIFVLNKKALEPDKTEIFEFEPSKMIKVFFIVFIMGIYDGLYGPGTGTFLLIFFVSMVKMDIKSANGISKAINWATNIGALCYFLYAGRAVIALGIMAGISNMIGSYLGSNLFAKKGVSVARPIMIVVMLIFIIKVALELLHIG